MGQNGLSEEPGSLLQQLGWVRLESLSKDLRPIQDFAQLVTLDEIQTKLSCKTDRRAPAGALNASDLSDDEDSTSHPKSRRKAKLPPQGLSSNLTKPLQVSATDTAKMSMTVQDPQLLDKMENVAYRLNIQADQRKKHMNSRGVFGDAQNTLRARSVQRLRLWKGLHPSALSEAVSHFTKSQQLQAKSSITRSGTLQTRAEKACLDVLSRLDADLPMSAIHGTLDAQASGKLSRAKLDNAMAGMAADYAAVRAKSRALSPEQEIAFSLRAAAAQAERLQQYRDKVAQQSAAIPAAASLHAQSNLEQLVDHMSQDEHTQHDTQARAEEQCHLMASGPALLQAVLARVKAAEEQLPASRLQRAATRAAPSKVTNLSRTISFFPEDEAASPAASEQGPASVIPRALSRAHTGTDYEFGKAYDKQDADRYFGGMQGVSVRSHSFLSLAFALLL
ncbi:hypothetical protein ABBQ32_008577 [Trebouxia sp. C0010 RCD-2024]